MEIVCAWAVRAAEQFDQMAQPPAGAWLKVADLNRVADLLGLAAVKSAREERQPLD